MCVRSNVWIDAKAYICHLLLGICQFVYDFKLRHTFHIEAENRGFKCQIYFPIGLSYACKNYFVSRKSRFNCGLNFSSAHAIGSKSSLCNYPQYFGISICFNSIVHMKVFFLRYLCANCLYCFLQQIRVIIIERCSYLLEFINWEFAFHLFWVLCRFCPLCDNFNILLKFYLKSVSERLCNAFCLSISLIRNDML